MTLRQFSTHYFLKTLTKTDRETGTLNQLTKNKKKNIKLGTLTFKNTLSENKVYYLKMAVRLNDSTRIYFYTKVQSGSGYHLDDYLAFVLKFHNNLFDKATMDENASYLETSADTIDDNLESVSINLKSSLFRKYGKTETKVFSPFRK